MRSDLHEIVSTLSIKVILQALERAGSRDKQGFTLVELLVVIAIIGILAVLLLLTFGTIRAKARNTKRIADVNNIRTASELYFDDNTSYPATIAVLETDGYLTNEPFDPSTLSSYGYGVSGTNYQVYAEMEPANLVADSGVLGTDADIDGTGWLPNGTDGDVETCAAAASCIFDLGQD